MANNAGNSKRVYSNQAGVNENIENIVRKHMSEEYQKPVAEHTLLAFKNVTRQLDNLRCTSIVLDSSCGTGDSTIHLAKQFPESVVIGIDKSMVRLQKLNIKDIPQNALYARADQFDFWRLVSESNWNVIRHFIFYPNPWPKKAHMMRRIHGHPAFIFLPKITRHIELRSNWPTYLNEFARAWHILTGNACAVREFTVNEPMTLFEKKFNDSGHQLYRLTTNEAL